MKDFSAQDTLLVALPVLLVLLALVGAIVFFPSGAILDIRGKAAPITPTLTLVPVPTASPTLLYRPPETVCSELYSPVCSTKTGKTYDNECQARLANDPADKTGTCPTATPTTKATATPIPLPSY